MLAAWKSHECFTSSHPRRPSDSDKLRTFTSCSESARNNMGGANTDLADDQHANRQPKDNGVSVLARTTTGSP